MTSLKTPTHSKNAKNSTSRSSRTTKTSRTPTKTTTNSTVETPKISANAQATIVFIFIIIGIIFTIIDAIILLGLLATPLLSGIAIIFLIPFLPWGPILLGCSLSAFIGAVKGTKKNSSQKTQRPPILQAFFGQLLFITGIILCILISIYIIICIINNYPSSRTSSMNEAPTLTCNFLFLSISMLIAYAGAKLSPKQKK